MTKTRVAGIISLVIIILAFILGVDPTEVVEQVPGLLEGHNEVTVSTVAGDDGWYEIYFTDPTCPAVEARTGGVDSIIAADILDAQESVDIVAYELNSEPITNALIEMEKRNVTVRVVIDADFEDEAAIRRLRRNGTSVITDDRRALMHNKFTVIDGRIVWTGSLNYTSNGAYCNNNNAVRFEVAELAANFEAEVDEMYRSGLFGPESPDTTPYEKIQINETLVENYFAPEKELAPQIARTVARANKEILFLAFSFTDDDVGEAILGRADGGVRVRGVFEKSGAGTEFSYYPLMRSANLANVEVRVDGNPRIMHHKVMIVDGETVLFGSYNYSENANRANDENIVIVHDPLFANYFVEEFEAIWREADSE